MSRVIKIDAGPYVHRHIQPLQYIIRVVHPDRVHASTTGAGAPAFSEGMGLVAGGSLNHTKELTLRKHEHMQPGEQSHTLGIQRQTHRVR